MGTKRENYKFYRSVCKYCGKKFIAHGNGANCCKKDACKERQNEDYNERRREKRANGVKAKKLFRMSKDRSWITLAKIDLYVELLKGMSLEQYAKDHNRTTYSVSNMALEIKEHGIEKILMEQAEEDYSKRRAAEEATLEKKKYQDKEKYYKKQSIKEAAYDIPLLLQQV